MMDICEAECLDDTSTVDVEEAVNHRKDYNNEIIDEEKEAECLDDTAPVDIDEGVSDRKDDNNKENS